MSLVVVEPKKMVLAQPLEPGTGSIDKTGRLTLHAEDAELIGLGDRAVILCDPDNLRIGIRAARDGESAAAVSVTQKVTRGGRKIARVALTVKHALRRLAVTPEAAAGRHELRVKDDQLLLINLGNDSVSNTR